MTDLPNLHTIESILSLPNGEHSWVEFKGIQRINLLDPNQCQKFLSSISPDLCSFANSGGGMLVLGIDEDKKTAVRAVSCGGIPAVRGRERMLKWLQDILPNYLDPKLSDFDVYEIASGDGLEEGKSVFVIDIRSSSRAPHQVRGTGVYYGRITDKAEPLPHQYVLDILNRAIHPKLEIAFKYNALARPHELVASVINSGRVPARLVSVQIWIHPRERTMPDGEDKMYSIFEGKYWRMFQQDLNPILPMRRREISISMVNEDIQGLRVKWNISADSAPIIEGETSLTEAHLMKAFDPRKPPTLVSD